MKHSLRIILSVTLLPLFLTPALAQEEQTAEPVNEIVIIGTRTARPLKESPVPVRVVDKKEIEAAGDVTAADAMSRVVGVHMESTVRTGQTPQIQGFSSKHVLVLIDGRRANGRLADDFDLARIPASSIERIEVLKGASSVLYGSDAIGGVINIVTKRPKKGFGGSVSLSRDSLHRNEASASITGGNDKVRARLDGGNQQGPSYDLNPDDIAQSGYGYNRSHGQFEMEVSAGESVTFSTALSSEDTVTEGLASGSGGAVLDRSTRARGRSARVGAQYRPDDQGEVRFEVGQSQRRYSFFDDQRDGDRLDRRLDSEESSSEASLVGSRTYGTHETVAGVEGANQEFESNQMEQGGKDRQRTSVFTQHEWSVLPELALVPGLRYDDDSQFGGELSKAFTVRYDPTAETVVRVTYGEGYRAPSFSELYLSFENLSSNYRVQGNPELQPERSRSGQVSVAWQPNDRIWSGLSLFENRVHDLITTERSRPQGVLLINYANVEKVRNRGAELSGRFRTAAALTLGLDYTFLEARDETRDRALEGRPMHSGAVQVRYDAKDTGISSALIVNLVGKRPYYIDVAGGQVTEWSEAYRSASLRVAKNFAKTLELFAGVRNITDEWQETYHAVPPRSYFGGVSASL